MIYLCKLVCVKHFFILMLILLNINTLVFSAEEPDDYTVSSVVSREFSGYAGNVGLVEAKNVWSREWSGYVGNTGLPDFNTVVSREFSGYIGEVQEESINNAISREFSGFVIHTPIPTPTPTQLITPSPTPTPTPTPTQIPVTYWAEVTAVSVDVAPAGTEVIIEGHAAIIETGQPADNRSVFLRIEVKGFSRWIELQTDSNGNFRFLFQPLTNEAGLYRVLATHPALIEMDDLFQAEFTLVGMELDPEQGILSISKNIPLTTDFTLINLGDTPLSGIQARLLDSHDSLIIDILAPQELLPNAESKLTLNLSTLDESGWTDEAILNVTSIEGATVSIPIYLTAIPSSPKLVANPGVLAEGMVKGEQNFKEITIMNTGGGIARNIEVFIPQVEWLSLITPQRLGDMEPGSSAKISMGLTPAEELPFGIYSGEVLVYYGADNSVLRIPFQFNLVDASTGDLQVIVEDEFTYFADGAPHVEGASVKLMDLFDSPVAEGETDASGSLIFRNLNAGQYNIRIDADNHNSYKGLVYIKPGILNEITAFLARDLVTYRWEVLPTTVVDEYTITVESLFETHVPAPVVTVEPEFFDLADFVGKDEVVNLTITNHGLIAAQGLELEYVSNSRFEVSPLVKKLGTLDAKTTFIVPIRIRDLQASANTPFLSKYQLLQGSSDPAVSNRNQSGNMKTLAQDAECDSLILCVLSHYDCNGPVFRCSSVYFMNMGHDCSGKVYIPPGHGKRTSGGTSVIINGRHVSGQIPCGP